MQFAYNVRNTVDSWWCAQALGLHIRGVQCDTTKPMMQYILVKAG